MSGGVHILALGLLSLLLFYYTEWHGGFAGAFLFYIFCLLAVYELLLYMTSFYGLQVERRLDKKRLQAGKAQRLTIQLNRKFRFPFVWYAAYEKASGYPAVPGQVVFPCFRKQIELQCEWPNLVRGLHELKEITIVSGDLFGLLKMKKTYTVPQSFIVYPKYLNLGHWDPANGQRNGHESIASQASEEQSSIVGVRDYAQGDRLSQIHWKATAKNQSLKTKEFEYQAEQYFSVLLDTNPERYPNKDSFEKAVSLTAALLTFGGRGNIKCSLLFEQEKNKLDQIEARHQHDFYRLLDALAVMELEGTSAISSLYERWLAGSGHETHLVIVTAQVDRSLVLLLNRLGTQKRKVEIFLTGYEMDLKGKEWLSKLQESGVKCHRVLA